MATKVVLVAAVGATQGPWVPYRGNEEKVEAICGAGCELEIQYQSPSAEMSTVAIDNSTQLAPCSRYRVVRKDSGTHPATVRVHFN